MGLFILLLITEILTQVVLKQHFFYKSKSKYTFSVVLTTLLSLWVWIIFFETAAFNSFYDHPKHVWLMMSMMGIIVAIIIPRIILIILHFTGKLINIKSGTHIRRLTNAGLSVVVVILSIKPKRSL